MTTQEIAEDIISILCDKKCFDSWWDGIDEETQEEIIKSIAEKINAALVR